MDEHKKGETRRVSLSDETVDRLKDLAQHTGLTQIEILSKAAAAAILAMHRNGKKITFPLEFEVREDYLATRDRPGGKGK
jgi:hypothetical protein